MRRISRREGGKTKTRRRRRRWKKEGGEGKGGNKLTEDEELFIQTLHSLDRMVLKKKRGTGRG
jgi:hypothetical protein